MTGEALKRDFFDADADVVAPRLLNKVFVVGRAGDDGFSDGAVSGRIVEVEAYRSDDPASHSFRGERRRNRSMFGRPGHLYVYLSYGIHHCVNVVCGPPGDGQAVLLRAVEPLSGVELMRRRRGAVRDGELANGPGKLGAAFGIDLGLDGVDVVAGERGVRIVDDGTPPPERPVVTGRVGISVGVDHPWRWCVPGSWSARRPVGGSRR